VLFSVVIPALNEERHLGQLLSDIQRQSQSPDELIVVDAGSSDAIAFVSDRRYREEGILRTFLVHLLMAPAFALGKFEWANRVVTSSETTTTRLETIRQSADQATLLGCGMKATLGLRHLRARRCGLSRDAEDFIHPKS
jgi:cellulose synthase/poly-beta-1,6-N-acetylglucosamine synthase-like glycosyltransferase